MTRASRFAFYRMTAIGTAGYHGLARLATGCLHFAAGVADVLTGFALGFHGIRFRFMRFIAHGFCCVRER